MDLATDLDKADTRKRLDAERAALDAFAGYVGSGLPLLLLTHVSVRHSRRQTLPMSPAVLRTNWQSCVNSASRRDKLALSRIFITLHCTRACIAFIRNSPAAAATMVVDRYAHGTR